MDTLARNARTSAVAAAVGLSVASIQAYARAGRIPFRLTPGRQYRFNVEEVRELLAPEPLADTGPFIDVFASTGPAVDELSIYRADPIDAAAERRLRMRAVRPDDRTGGSRSAYEQSAGRNELSDVMERSSGVATAVLHRDLAEV